MNPSIGNSSIERLRKLVSALEASLARGARDPDVEAVHRTRTGTRRIEAQLDVLERGTANAETGAGFAPAMKKMRKLLKRMRRAVAPARDLDVHRHLLRDLLELSDPVPSDTVPSDPVKDEAGKLDHWLKEGREQHARRLQRSAAKWSGRLEENFVRLAASMPQAAGRRRAPNAARTALGAFAMLSGKISTLDAGNLHDFRKGAKKARYIAEASGAEPRALAVVKALKKLQDAIGAWHDWLVLAEEAHTVLGDGGPQLIARLETERDRHYAEAVQVSEHMRERLMSEWQSMQPSRNRRQAAAH